MVSPLLYLLIFYGWHKKLIRGKQNKDHFILRAIPSTNNVGLPDKAEHVSIFLADAVLGDEPSEAGGTSIVVNANHFLAACMERVLVIESRNARCRGGAAQKCWGRVILWPS